MHVNVCVFIFVALHSLQLCATLPWGDLLLMKCWCYEVRASAGQALFFVCYSCYCSHALHLSSFDKLSNLCTYNCIVFFVSWKVICMTREYVYFLFCWEWDEKIDIIQKSRCIQQRVGLKQWETCQQHLRMSAFHVVKTALKHIRRIKYGYRRVSNSVRIVTQKRNVLHIFLKFSFLKCNAVRDLIICQRK